MKLKAFLRNEQAVRLIADHTPTDIVDEVSGHKRGVAITIGEGIRKFIAYVLDRFSCDGHNITSFRLAVRGKLG